jgi:hypothetical protein
MMEAVEGRMAEIWPRYRADGRAHNLRLELPEALDGEPAAAIVALKRWFLRTTYSRLDPVFDSKRAIFRTRSSF